jgi:hypothetical protein
MDGYSLTAQCLREAAPRPEGTAIVTVSIVGSNTAPAAKVRKDATPNFRGAYNDISGSCYDFRSAGSPVTLEQGFRTGAAFNPRQPATRLIRFTFR